VLFSSCAFRQAVLPAAGAASVDGPGAIRAVFSQRAVYSPTRLFRRPFSKLLVLVFPLSTPPRHFASLGSFSSEHFFFPSDFLLVEPRCYYLNHPFFFRFAGGVGASSAAGKRSRAALLFGSRLVDRERAEARFLCRFFFADYGTRAGRFFLARHASVSVSLGKGSFRHVIGSPNCGPFSSPPSGASPALGNPDPSFLFFFFATVSLFLIHYFTSSLNAFPRALITSFRLIGVSFFPLQ